MKKRADMEVETMLNGSHGPETDTTEKILKPRKPKNTAEDSNKEQKGTVQNGNTDAATELTDNTKKETVENGRTECLDSTKENGGGTVSVEKEEIHKEVIHRSLRRSTRESTPKKEYVARRELRKKESTPSKMTPKKQVAHSKKEVVKSLTEFDEETKAITGNSQEQDQDHVHVLSDSSEVVVVDDTEIDDISGEDDDLEIKEVEIIDIGPIFSSSCKKSVSEKWIEDTLEASTTSSTICTPSYDVPLPSRNIKGRRPLNAFSSFPGRTVCISSTNKSGKRRAESFIDNIATKRFALEENEMQSSEKSPGKK